MIENNGGKCSSANFVSMMETAKRPITRQMAFALARIFEIDASYLLDENVEYKNAADKFKAILQTTSKDNYFMLNAICSLAALNGYDVEIQDIKNTGGIEDITTNLKDYVIFKQNGKRTFSLSIDEANNFGNRLSELFEMLINFKYKANRI